MTNQERRQEFMVEYRKLIERTGFQITPAINSRQYGNAMMVEPVAQVLPVPDWQPSPEAEDEVVAKVSDTQGSRDKSDKGNNS